MTIQPPRVYDGSDACGRLRLAGYIKLEQATSQLDPSSTLLARTHRLVEVRCIPMVSTILPCTSIFEIRRLRAQVRHYTAVHSDALELDVSPRRLGCNVPSFGHRTRVSPAQLEAKTPHGCSPYPAHSRSATLSAITAMARTGSGRREEMFQILL